MRSRPAAVERDDARAGLGGVQRQRMNDDRLRAPGVVLGDREGARVDRGALLQVGRGTGDHPSEVGPCGAAGLLEVGQGIAGREAGAIGAVVGLLTCRAAEGDGEIFLRAHRRRHARGIGRRRGAGRGRPDLRSPCGRIDHPGDAKRDRGIPGIGRRDEGWVSLAARGEAVEDLQSGGAGLIE